MSSDFSLVGQHTETLLIMVSEAHDWGWHKWYLDWGPKFTLKEKWGTVPVESSEYGWNDQEERMSYCKIGLIGSLV